MAFLKRKEKTLVNCIICGNPFSGYLGNSKYCKDCAFKKLKPQFPLCVLCGEKTFSNFDSYCKDCRKIRNEQIMEAWKKGATKRNKKYWLETRDLPDYKKKRQKRMKIWYLNNKEKQNFNSLKNYRKNKKRWYERAFVGQNKRFIWEELGNKCNRCQNQATQIHHLKYDFPKRKQGRKTEQEKKKLLKEYCKFLEPLCTNCHSKIHRKALLNS